MSVSVPRGAMRAIFAHARRVPLTPAPGVSVRACRAVLLALVTFVDRDTWAGAWPAVATLAERAEVSVRTARRALRILEAAGVIVTELGGGRRSSRYRIVRPESASFESGQTGQDDRRSPVSTRSSLRSERRTTAAPNPKRSTTVPEDLRPLADALTSRGLRASFSLTTEQVAEVRAAVARHGIGSLVRAAYAAHRAANPARWWSAYIAVWSGLHKPPAPVPAATPRDAPPPRDADRNARGAAAARAALAARGIYSKAGAR